MYSHQDWKTVVLKQQPVAKPAPQKTFELSREQKIEKQIEDDTKKPLNYVSREDANLVIQGRIGKKWTQKQLAQHLNLQEKDIKDIECCKMVENRQLLAKIKQVLK